MAEDREHEQRLNYTAVYLRALEERGPANRARLVEPREMGNGQLAYAVAPQVLYRLGALSGTRSSVERQVRAPQLGEVVSVSLPLGAENAPGRVSFEPLGPDGEPVTRAWRVEIDTESGVPLFRSQEIRGVSRCRVSLPAGRYRGHVLCDGARPVAFELDVVSGFEWTQTARFVAAASSFEVRVVAGGARGGAPARDGARAPNRPVDEQRALIEVIPEAGESYFPRFSATGPNRAGPAGPGAPDSRWVSFDAWVKCHEPLSIGTTRVRVTCPGYAPTELPVPFDEDGSVRIEVTLEPR